MAFIMVDMAFGLSMVTDLLTSEAYCCIHPTYCGLEWRVRFSPFGSESEPSRFRALF